MVVVSIQINYYFDGNSLNDEDRNSYGRIGSRVSIATGGYNTQAVSDESCLYQSSDFQSSIPFSRVEILM